jgi:hypothetical protein
MVMGVMWVVTTTATASGLALEARTNSPYLKGMRWVWHGGRLVDYGLDPGGPVDCISVPYDFATGVVGLPFSVTAYRDWIAEYYTDHVNVRSARTAVARA